MRERCKGVMGGVSKRWLAWGFSIEKSISAKRTQLKNAQLFRNEQVEKKTSWVRYAKNGAKNGVYAAENGVGTVVLRTNEPKLQHSSALPTVRRLLRLTPKFRSNEPVR